MTTSFVSPAKAHFWNGFLPTAFVFSVPGQKEMVANRPLSGVAGENLSFSLAHLNRSDPLIFPSVDRYAYRITNAYPHPIARSLGHRRSEPRASQILESQNVIRVFEELRECRNVVLCGLSAQMLFPAISERDRGVFCTWHTSNQALAQKFNPSEVALLSTPLARRRARAKLWAEDLSLRIREPEEISGFRTDP